MLNELPMYSNSLVRKALFFACSLVAVSIAILLYAYFGIIRAPSGTQYPTKITIENGQGLQSMSRELERAGIIRSAKIAQNLLVSRGGEKKIPAGVYVFEYPMSLFGVVHKMQTGDYGYIPTKLTVPEGTGSKKLAVLVNAKFPYIATSTFEMLAHEKEGYLFPETYFFYPEATPEEILSRMSEVFEQKIASLKDDIASSGKSLQEILTVASILEGEVQTSEDRALVADLIYRRMEAGMPLQVDTTLVYSMGKTSAELTLKDLRTDNPYNTYTRKGLPPTPISNPGLDSIEAAMHPTPNEYLFYLSDKDGITHFSKTHEEHVKLKSKYLR